MAARNKLLKYYLLLGLLVLFTTGAVAYTLSLAGAAKSDKIISDKVVSIASKLDGYISHNSQLPATLDDAGVNNVPGAITYARLGQTEYKFCATYSSAAGGFGAGWSALFTGALTSLHVTPAVSAGDNSLDVYSMAYAHKKGQTCQTVKPPGVGPLEGSSKTNGLGSLSPSAGSTPKAQLLPAKCGNAGASFELKDQTTVKAIDSGQGIITLNTLNAKLTDRNSAPVTSLGSIKYDSLTTVYSASCKSATTASIDALKPGSTITIYLYSHDGTYADQAEL